VLREGEESGQITGMRLEPGGHTKEVSFPRAAETTNLTTNLCGEKIKI
jgi:hypothetical protein